MSTTVQLVTRQQALETLKALEAHFTDMVIVANVQGVCAMSAGRCADIATALSRCRQWIEEHDE